MFIVKNSIVKYNPMIVFHKWRRTRNKANRRRNTGRFEYEFPAFNFHCSVATGFNL
jgi:hypothetical protein